MPILINKIPNFDPNQDLNKNRGLDIHHHLLVEEIINFRHCYCFQHLVNQIHQKSLFLLLIYNLLLFNSILTIHVKVLIEILIIVIINYRSRT